MTDFYVYVHRKATNGQIFYVGKGSGSRAYEFGRNDHWNRTAKKHGFKVEIVENGLQEWYALELEINLIAYYGRQDLRLGTLVNKTDGGESIVGLIITEEHKHRLRISHLGNTSHLGKPHTEEAKNKIRVAQDNEESRKRLKEMHLTHKGSKWSEESKARLRSTLTGRGLTESWKANIKASWVVRKARGGV